MIFDTSDIARHIAIHNINMKGILLNEHTDSSSHSLFWRTVNQTCEKTKQNSPVFRFQHVVCYLISNLTRWLYESIQRERKSNDFLYSPSPSAPPHHSTICGRLRPLAADHGPWCAVGWLLCIWPNANTHPVVSHNDGRRTATILILWMRLCLYCCVTSIVLFSAYWPFLIYFSLASTAQWQYIERPWCNSWR